MQLQALLIVLPAFMALVSSTPLPHGDEDHGLDRRSNETQPIVETQHQSYAREASPQCIKRSTDSGEMESAACGGHQSYARDIDHAPSNETGPIVETQHQSYARDVKDAPSNETGPVVETQHQSYARDVKDAASNETQPIVETQHQSYAREASPQCIKRRIETGEMIESAACGGHQSYARSIEEPADVEDRKPRNDGPDNTDSDSEGNMDEEKLRGGHQSYA